MASQLPQYYRLTLERISSEKIGIKDTTNAAWGVEPFVKRPGHVRIWEFVTSDDGDIGTIASELDTALDGTLAVDTGAAN